MKIKGKIGHLRRYIKWRFYKFVDSWIEKRFKDKIKDVWYELWKEDRYRDHFQHWERQELERKAGGHFVPNPDLVRSWKPGELPSDPNKPLYIFVEHKK